MRGLLLLLSALLLLESTDGNKEYHQLSQNDARIVDRAIQLANTDKEIQQVNEKFGAKHLDFAFILKAVSDLFSIRSLYCKFLIYCKLYFDFVFSAYASA